MISIGVAARQTGLEICTLRKWEERYGFPQPVRLKSGQRRYLEREVEQLLVVVRRVAAGERPGKVIRELCQNSLAVPTLPETASSSQVCESIEIALAALVKHDVPALRATLEEALGSRSMAAFIEEIAGPMTRLVGECWAQGELPIHGEHLYASVLDSLLVRQTTLSRGAGAKPTVLLTTASGEQHTLGLSMVEAALGAVGVSALRLQGGLPVSEIVAAVDAYQIKAVGVSASSLYPPKILSATMQALRDALPPDIQLWFGGAGVSKLCHIPPGVSIFASMFKLQEASLALCIPDQVGLETPKTKQ